MSLNHRTIKIAFATVIAILIAQFFDLNYSVAAGVIAILSVLDTKKSSVLTALQRIASTVLALTHRDASCSASLASTSSFSASTCCFTYRWPTASICNPA